MMHAMEGFPMRLSSLLLLSLLLALAAPLAAIDAAQPATTPVQLQTADVLSTPSGPHSSV
jgi:hypothetical protein